MKRFAILRPGDPSVTRQDIDSWAILNTVALLYNELEKHTAEWPDIRAVSWVRSYWAPGTSWSMCLYTGPDLANVGRYNEFCSMPFLAINEVVETACVDAELRLANLSQTIPGLITVVASGEDLPDGAAAWGEFAPQWVRSYVGTSQNEVVAAFVADGLDFDALKAQTDKNGWTLHRVVEIRPDEYLAES